MTLLYSTATGDGPGTHVLAIGVGNYPHLLGGSGPLAERPLGLGQLESPPVSLIALLSWLLAPTINPRVVGLANPQAPLASVAALGSSNTPISITTPGGNHLLAAATLTSIQNAFDEWLERVQRHPDNVGVFYFCGHGVMVADHYLLAEDFGADRRRPWENGFNITTTMRALEREVAGALYYFIDACREVPRDMLFTQGSEPAALTPIDLEKESIRRSVTALFATGEGQLAFSRPGGNVSRFTSALLGALSGYCGVKEIGSRRWIVDGEILAAAVRKLLDFELINNQGNLPSQTIDHRINGRSIPLISAQTAPKVKVWIDLSPPDQRSSYELYLQHFRGQRTAQIHTDQAFQVEVQPGFYEVGAIGASADFPSMVHPDEQLDPPVYPLTFKVINP
ncbi:caspase family protein [Pseudomonas sp. ok266]|uniref:caspase family protein n=1 Tax=Pseudomonas sp. ok266 TaxID=1761896 RepID=UPI0008BF2873|nr:caspase family protein [Pseudomonas sp. ok266]SEM93164.1 Caspase domain-containing protein [Pseudomonas sp. ok266]